MIEATRNTVGIAGATNLMRIALTVLVASLLLSACSGNDEAEPTPTPETEEHLEGLTFEEAQDALSMELIQPDPLPERLELIEINVSLPTEEHSAEEAVFLYRLAEGDMPGTPIVFEQSSSVGRIEHPDAVEKEIGSRTVTTFTIENSEGVPLIIHSWAERDSSYLIQTPVTGDVREQDPEDLIRALPD